MPMVEVSNGGTYDSATLSGETLAPSVGTWFTKTLTAASDTIYVLRIYNTDYRNGSVVSSTGDILLYSGADTSDMTAVVHCSPGQSMTYSFRKTVNSNATSYLVTIV